MVFLGPIPHPGHVQHPGPGADEVVTDPEQNSLSGELVGTQGGLRIILRDLSTRCVSWREFGELGDWCLDQEVEE